MIQRMKSLAARLDDHLNPMVVKELRQAVRGKFLPVLLIAYLIFQLFVMMLFLASTSPENIDGSELAIAFLSIFLVITILLIPMSTAIRISSERAEDGVDLFYITTMKPRHIITGKFYAGLILSQMFYFATLPFWTFTAMLRGVDLPSLLTISVLAMLFAAVFLQLMILVACLPMGRLLRLILGLGSIGFLCMAIGITTSALTEMEESGIGQRLLEGDSILWMVLVSILFAILVIIAMQFMATALIAPATANNAPPIRLLILALWFLGLALTVVQQFDLEIWIALITLFSCGGFVQSLSEREHYGHRLRKTIPNNLLKRIPHFFLSSGACNSLFFHTTLFALSLALVYLKGISDRDLITLCALGMYGLAYSLTGFFIYRKYLHHRMRKGLAWTIPLYLFVAVVLLCFVLTFILEGNSWDSDDAILFTLTPFLVDSRSAFMRETSLMVSTSWALIAGLCNVPWIFRSIYSFKPPPYTLDQEAM